MEFIIQIANRTRASNYIRLGMSPRASLHLQLAAQSYAFVAGRAFVIPEDVIAVCRPVLSHRVILSAEARMENKSADQIVDQIVKSCDIPAGI